MLIFLNEGEEELLKKAKILTPEMFVLQLFSYKKGKMVTNKSRKINLLLTFNNVIHH